VKSKPNNIQKSSKFYSRFSLVYWLGLMQLLLKIEQKRERLSFLVNNLTF